ncbi:MAG: hypothetical protein IKL84_04750, partial [Clostridia bacterium]|nr:hypothetical protein [Clostridia bacterium]
TVVTVLNTTCSKIEFHTDAKTLYKTLYATLAGGKVVLADGSVIGEYTYEKAKKHIDGVENDIVFTVEAADTYVDGYGNFLPVLETGTELGVTVYDTTDNPVFAEVIVVG